MSEKIWSDDAWEDYLYLNPSPATCRANTAAASTKKTASSTIWKTGGSTSPTAEATMEINNPNQSPPASKTGI